MKIKQCVRCKKNKTVDNFCVCARSKDGLSSYCRNCKSEYARERREATPVEYRKKKREYNKRWSNKNPVKAKHLRRINAKKYYDNNKEASMARSKKWAQKNKDRCRFTSRKSKLKLKYGITIKQYDIMRSSQNDECALCKTPFDSNTNIPHIDHNHLTNQVRGLLCFKCNVLLGAAEDNTQRLEAAIRYLINH